MPTPAETLWELDPHTTAKHEILQRYLGAWFPILNRHYGRIVYIDGFAGPGRYIGGEPGSPLIALDVAANHRRALMGEVAFWFIDERDDRVKHLTQELTGTQIPPHFKVHTEAGRFDEKVDAVLQSIEAGGRNMAPTFAFIDPFGFSGIPISVIERLLRHPHCEVLITFMVDSINRFLEADQVTSHIVDAFGTADALRIARAPDNRIESLRALYQSRLEQMAGYVRYFEMKNRHDRTQYYLFFASNHPLGHTKMKEAMWRVDPDGDFRFSDATNPRQLVLFEADTTSLLIKQLRDELAGQGVVTGAQLRKFVENRTAYLKKHMTAALRQEEAEGRIKVGPTKQDGKPRRAGTYPDDVMLTFI